MNTGHLKLSKFYLTVPYVLEDESQDPLMMGLKSNILLNDRTL